MRRLAVRLGMVDRPDRHRKIHENETPLGGGVAVYVGLMAGVVVLYVVDNPVRALLQEHTLDLVAFLLAGATICGIGLLDDSIHLRGRQKLAGQVLAAGVLIGFGLIIEKISLFGWTLELGLLAIPFTFFWLLGATNALNLLDGIDGLATSVGLIVASAVGVMAWTTGHLHVGVVCMLLAASLAGFLYWNFPPARIYLGDAGSMLIGLWAGALAIQGSLKGPATAALAAPLAVWAIPALDSLAAIARRKLTGRSIYAADRGHLHHCLINHGLSNKATLAAISVLCLLTAGGAVGSVYWNNEYLAVLLVLALVAILVVCRIFGHAEWVLMQSRLRAATASLLKQPDEKALARTNIVRLQGSHSWEAVWEQLVEMAEDQSLSEVELSVNLPAAHEHYYAHWSCLEEKSASVWTIKFPLMSGQQEVGQLAVSSLPQQSSVCGQISTVSAGLVELEDALLTLAGLAIGTPALSVVPAMPSRSGTVSADATAVLADDHHAFAD